VSADLEVSIGSLPLRNPVICGSGEHTMSYDAIVAAIDAGAAGVVAKSANESEAARRQLDSAEYILLDDRFEPLNWQPGSTGPLPRSASLLNRSGLVPVAFDDWVETLARADTHARGLGAYVIGSLIPADATALPQLAVEMERAGLRWLELNLSAPHAEEAIPGAIERAAGADRVRELTASVRAAVGLPITVKLTADGADPVALARAAVEAGADSICVTGRQLAFVPDLGTRRPVLGTFAAIGGSWALPLTLRWIAKIRLALGASVPVLGTNGARNGFDVARSLLAGATAVQLATSVFVEGSGSIGRAIDELRSYLAEQRMSARDLVGEAADATMTYEEAAMRHPA
jgi:dihydroorotate dehydrogenase (NAD+) catalytic subunit